MVPEEHPVLSSAAAGIVVATILSPYIYFRLPERSLGQSAIVGALTGAGLSLTMYQQMRQSRLTRPIPLLSLVGPGTAVGIILGLVFAIVAVVTQKGTFLSLTALLWGSAAAMIALRYLAHRLPRRRVE